MRDAIKLFRKRGINSITVGFMFAFLNDEHERRAKEIILEEMPDAYVTLSSEVANVMREYERFSTAAMNCLRGAENRVLPARPGIEAARSGRVVQAAHHAVERRRFDRRILRGQADPHSDVRLPAASSAAPRKA